MIIGQVFRRTGIIEYFVVRYLVQWSRRRQWRLLVLLSLFTALISAFIDNVTTIMMIVPITMEVCGVLMLDPQPFIITEALFSNIGGTATMIGSPSNVILSSLLDDVITFADFLRYILPVSTHDSNIF